MASSEARRLAQKLGYRFDRYANGSHQIWRHKHTDKTLLVPTSKKGWHGWKAFKADAKRKAGL